LSAQATQRAARDWALVVKTALSEGSDVSDKLAALELSWKVQKAVTRNDANLSQNIVDALFKLSVTDTTVVDLVTGDISLVQLSQVNAAAEANVQQITSLQGRLASSRSQALYGAVIESLKAQADIEIYQ
jgi:peptidyl-prolyl cis-trans isomerase D